MARVLVVEDEPGIALGLEDSLRLEGYQVELVGDGLNASRRAREAAFDLILLDVMLPGRNGFDVCRDLRSSGIRTPIIFLTAKTQEADRIWGLDLGANDYVTKPFSPRELMARVRGLLRFVESGRQDLRRFEHEMAAATRVQRRLFPSSKPAVGGLDYAGVCRPALEVSGDYYDFFALPSGCLALVLADVCGKGMPAALLAASLHAAVRAFAPEAGRSCGDLLSHVNRFLFDTTSEERFATVFYAVYDPADRTLTWANAGHCAPLWVHESACDRLDSLTPPTGMFPTVPLAERTAQLMEGDGVLIVSDGVLEACDRAGEEFGESRLLELVRRHPHTPAPCLCAAILDEVSDFSLGCPQADDQTIMALLTQR